MGAFKQKYLALVDSARDVDRYIDIDDARLIMEEQGLFKPMAYNNVFTLKLYEEGVYEDGI